MNLDKIKLFIWQPSIEHINYYTWLAIQSSLKTPITFVLSKLQNPVRVAQKWKFINLESINPILMASNSVWVEGKKMLEENPDAIHIFWGFRGSKGFNTFPLILYALRKGIKIVVINESYSISPVGYYSDESVLKARLKTIIRPVLYWTIAKLTKAFSKSFKPCIMLISLIAKEQCLKAGFDLATLFPFGYFVPKQLNKPNQNKIDMDKFRIIFVGALIKRKGFDILEEAVRNLCEQGYQIEIDVYGAGELKKKYPDLPIYYKGTLPFDEIQSAIAERDVLILPSRHDGWGVVVNEALLQGVPVIVSDRVGAKCMIESRGAGLVFETENVQDLSTKIKMVIDDSSLLNSLRKNASAVSSFILPEAAAKYFIDVLEFYFYGEGPYPQALWCYDVVDKTKNHKNSYK